MRDAGAGSIEPIGKHDALFGMDSATLKASRCPMRGAVPVSAQTLDQGTSDAALNR